MNEEQSLWRKEQAETELIWRLGEAYPTAVICIVYETNQFGERRLVENKTFKLVEEERA